MSIHGERNRRRAEYFGQAEEAEESLADKSVAELRELAAAAGVEGRSGMNKEELIAALSEEE